MCGGGLLSFLDVLICLGLWLVTAWLWGRKPVFAQISSCQILSIILMYPYSDSATFDIGSQFALIGRVFSTGDTLMVPAVLFHY